MNFNFCPSCGNKGTVEKFDDTNYECRVCKWHFWNNAKATMFIVFAKENQMLFAKRSNEPNKGKYDLPGGFVDFGEDIYDATTREVAEELGIAITRDNLELLDIYFNDYMPGVFTIDVGFLVRRWQGDFKVGDDVAAVEWKPFSFVHDPLFCQKHYTKLDSLLKQRLGS